MTLSQMAFFSRVPAPASTPEPRRGEWLVVEHPASAAKKNGSETYGSEVMLLLGCMWT